MTYDEAVKHLDAFADEAAADPAWAHRSVGWSVWRDPPWLRQPGDLPWVVSIGDTRQAKGETREAAVVRAGEVLERRLRRFGMYRHWVDDQR